MDRGNKGRGRRQRGGGIKRGGNHNNNSHREAKGIPSNLSKKKKKLVRSRKREIVSHQTGENSACWIHLPYSSREIRRESLLGKVINEQLEKSQTYENSK